MNIHQIKQYLFNNLWYGENGTPRKTKRAATVESLIPPPDASRVWGVDVSHWNIPPVDLPRMVSLYGMSFVIIKGCDGSVYSKYYFDHVAKAREAGIPWGMYVWLYPNDKVPVSAQVNAWLARYNVDKPPLGLFIDAEWTYYGGQPANPTAADLRLAHDLWKSRSGEKATTYTAAGYANQYLTGFDWTREELWIANYGVTSPALPKGASAWTFWQFTNVLDGKALDPTGNSELDGNYFFGTEAEFVQWYIGGEVPPDGGIMKEGVLTPTTSSLRIRSGPSTAFPQIGGILPNDKVYGVVDSVSGWLHIEWIIRAGGLREDIDGWCSANPVYITLTDYVPPPVVPVSMEVELPKGATLTLTFSDGSKESWTA
jgi:GH25 family lysozyme M1 (1,4-beta-N-acetylmuramidase)